MVTVENFNVNHNEHLKSIFPALPCIQKSAKRTNRTHKPYMYRGMLHLMCGSTL